MTLAELLAVVSECREWYWYIVDGGWSAWSTWMSCVYAEKTSNSDHCLCRTRSCNDPHPRNGGRQCRGRNIEVSNCTCKS